MEAERSMLSSVAEVQALPCYALNGEVHYIYIYIYIYIYVGVSDIGYSSDFRRMQWVIIDTWHDSTANAYHTAVPRMIGS